MGIVGPGLSTLPASSVACALTVYAPGSSGALTCHQHQVGPQRSYVTVAVVGGSGNVVGVNVTTTDAIPDRSSDVYPGTVPVLVTVTIRSPVVAPVGTEPKSRVLGDTAMSGTPPPTTVRYHMSSPGMSPVNPLLDW